ncbi:hypothetical protein C6558_23870 [Ensifer sp. NM-2]|nr:hypothetical protein ASD00_28635 [Ensifer sp. Root31]KQW77882.1 hypothetical protein ASD03_26985 [Ensifer sp. Root127]PSS62204.1 hypothetical protein C6558_23870 [Ensifer sp. NM-2]
MWVWRGALISDWKSFEIPLGGLAFGSENSAARRGAAIFNPRIARLFSLSGDMQTWSGSDT